MEADIGGRATRVLAALAIALGVLAMHGLAGGHHGAVPALPSLTAATAGSEMHSTGAGHAAEHAGQVLLAAPSRDSALVDGCDGDCGHHSAGLLLLCVAVLLAAAGALLLALALRTWRTVPATGPPTPRPRRDRAHRRLDPVSDLCVSRT